MIHKLKKKFILIMMAFVSFILLTLFGILCFLHIQQQQRDIQQALHWALEENNKQGPQLDFQKPFKKENHNPMISSNTFTIYTDKNYQFLSLHTNFYQVSTTQAKELISTIQKTNKSKGILYNLHLAYEYQDTTNGYMIGIVDISYQIEQLYQFLFTSCIVGVLSFSAFLCMSILLSKWALRPVEQAWTQQKQFIADASHELKTPLTIILADSDILLTSSTSSKEQQKWILSIKSEAMRMKKLVEQLLFLAKHDTSKVQVNMEICDLSEIVWSCVLPYESIAFEHKIQLESNIEDDISILGNQDQLKQLLLIFLDNAVKYTPPHHLISLSLIKQEHNAILTIKNTGSFIEKSDIPHIFERFYRCDRSRVYQGGYGLGLSIASQIAKIHHIKVNVTSDKEHGTSFILTIPSKKRTSL